MTTRALFLTISFGMLLTVLGLMVIFLFSTQVLVPAQPAIPGHWEWKVIDGVTRNVWYAGQPSQPEHFETSYPNLPTGLGLIFAGLAIPAVGIFFQKRPLWQTGQVDQAFQKKSQARQKHSL